VHRAAHAPHHFVEIRPRHGERRHERLGERKWRAVDLELEDLDAVADEGDGVARVGRVRDDLGQGAGLEGLEVLRLSSRRTGVEPDPETDLERAARHEECVREPKRIVSLSHSSPRWRGQESVRRREPDLALGQLQRGVRMRGGRERRGAQQVLGDWQRVAHVRGRKRAPRQS
jgi:hypothetical protein